MLCQINSLVAVLLLCIAAIDAAVPPHRYLTAGLPEGQQLFSVIERSNNVAESGRTDCCGPGYTFDKCASSRLCQYPRFCINEHTQLTCGYSYEEPCHCVPIDMVECVHPSQCVTPYETCAYLPHDKPYCYSYDIVKLNGSFTEYTGGDCCGGGPTTAPPSTTYAPPSYAPPSYAPPSYGPPSYAPPSYAPPSDAPPSYSPPTVAPPSNAPPSNAPPSNAPSYAPPSDTPPSTVAPPGSPPPSLSPWPSQRPVTPVPLPSQKGPNYGTSPSPSPTEGGRTGDQCEPVTRPCISYRECVDANTRQPCTSSCTGVCINAIVCKCSSDCFDGEVCAGAENQPGRYCFSPDVIASLPWAIEYECTTGMTGDPCTDDSACKDGRTCVQGGRSECLSGQALCGVDRPPCQAGDEYCYCNAIKSCTCTDNCDDSEVCCKTAYGQMCISRESARGNANLTQVPCDQNLPPAGSAYALADSVPPYREDSSPTPVTTDSSGTSDDTGDDDSNGDTSSDTVCVDARALSHIPRDELVYTEHVLSTVLCDRSGSCATPGHIVLYRGTAMMMKTYCKVAGCSYRKLFVNSPKYRRRLQIPSNTHSLTFTTFAARFATTAEELVLSTIVHAGL